MEMKEIITKVNYCPRCTKSKRTKLFLFMDSDEEDTEIIYTDESELREYLLKPTIPGNSNPLAFWKDHADTYPKLAV